MIEKDREIVASRINDKIGKEKCEQERLKQQYQKLEELKSDPSVIQYLQLLSDLQQVEDRKERLPKHQVSLDETIRLEFLWAFGCQSSFQDKKKGITRCEHEIWLYSRPVYVDPEPYSRCLIPFTREKQTSCYYPTQYYEYVCLECGKSVQVFNREEFENTHFVLGHSQERISGTDVEKYQNLYYLLLYEHTVTEARQGVIEQFNKDLEQLKQNVKTKRY